MVAAHVTDQRWCTKHQIAIDPRCPVPGCGVIHGAEPMPCIPDCPWHGIGD